MLCHHRTPAGLAAPAGHRDRRHHRAAGHCRAGTGSQERHAFAAGRFCHCRQLILPQALRGFIPFCRQRSPHSARYCAALSNRLTSASPHLGPGAPGIASATTPHAIPGTGHFRLGLAGPLLAIRSIYFPPLRHFRRHSSPSRFRPIPGCRRFSRYFRVFAGHRLIAPGRASFAVGSGFGGH